MITKDHANIYLAIFKQPYGGGCHSDNKNWNYEQGVLKGDSYKSQKRTCDEMMFGTSWEVGWKIIESNEIAIWTFRYWHRILVMVCVSSWL